MAFEEILDQALALLQRRGRVAYRVLKRQFNLDDEALEDLKESLLFAHPEVADEAGQGLVWTKTDTSTSVAEVPSTERTYLHTRAALSEQPPPEGERRQLTVMFCDLVGSTALSEQLDPEELRDVIRAYQQTSAEVVERFHGYVAQYLGDGLLVYFGYPVAHEDEATQAVRAGLGIVGAVQDLNRRVSHSIQVRVGIHTGLVVVGEMGSGTKREHLALGETPNIAARVQGQTAPDSVAISADTYRLVQGFFTCQSLGEQELKGLSAPLTLYHVQSEGEAQSRFDVSMQKGLTPLVGREEEVELLRRRWQRVKAGAGQVILLSGEAGIGKSRLVQNLRQDSQDDPHWSVEARCLPFYQNSALYPVIDQLQRFLQFEREDSPQVKRRKLEQALTPRGLASQEQLGLFAGLLSIPVPEPPIPLSPHKQKEKTLEAVVWWLQKEAEQQPVRFEVEDLHWADPSTLEFLGLLLDQVVSSRILVVLTYRPEFRPPWSIRGHMLTLTLSRLLEQDIALMTERMTGGKALPPSVVQQLITKTDGVPLFVEELTKNVLESDLLQETDGHYALSGPPTALAIPSTLHDSLMARLDRLHTAREVAQLGATIGREFSYELLHAITAVEEAVLQQGLQQLIEAELAYQQGVPPESVYTFKHALIQEAAYQSVLKSKRQQLHKQIAQVLE